MVFVLRTAVSYSAAQCRVPENGIFVEATHDVSCHAGGWLLLFLCRGVAYVGGGILSAKSGLLYVQTIDVCLAVRASFRCFKSSS